jgi:hypothetical protein
MAAEWITDARGNRCSVEYWGTKEAAQAALDSLKNCDNCTNCSRCSGCSRCSDCSHIAYLYDKRDQRADPSADPATPLGQPAIPKIENIHRRVYEAASREGALKMSDVHTCATTHCRAGWVVHLGGEAGYALERYHDWNLAARMIYRESGYRINPGQFYASNEDALADMRRLAEEEAARGAA